MAITRKRTMQMQLDVNAEYIHGLEEIMREAGITKRKDLFNVALSLLAWVVNERRKNRKIVSVDSDADSYRELLMPFSPFAETSQPFGVSSSQET